MPMSDDWLRIIEERTTSNTERINELEQKVARLETKMNLVAFFAGATFTLLATLFVTVIVRIWG